MFRLICMSFDGDYVTEGRDFKTPKDAGIRSEDMGSRWFFYPFHFVTTGSGLTIKETPSMLSVFKGMRVKTVVEIFKRTAKLPEAQEVGPDEFALMLLKG